MHIVGTPALAARETGATLHHNLPGRDYGHFAQMAAEVTAAQADLRPDTAPEEIDRVLGTALRSSRPVYLTIPADVAGIPVLAPAGRLPRATGNADPAVVAAFTGRARKVLAAASRASLLVGHLAARHRVTGQVRGLAIAGDLPVAVLSMAKGDFPEPDPCFAGLYAGLASAKRARVAVEDADVLITVGVTPKTPRPCSRIWHGRWRPRTSEHEPPAGPGRHVGGCGTSALKKEDLPCSPPSVPTPPRPRSARPISGSASS